MTSDFIQIPNKTDCPKQPAQNYPNCINTTLCSVLFVLYNNCFLRRISPSMFIQTNKQTPNWSYYICSFMNLWSPIFPQCYLLSHSGSMASLTKPISQNPHIPSNFIDPNPNSLLLQNLSFYGVGSSHIQLGFVGKSLIQSKVVAKCSNPTEALIGKGFIIGWLGF